MQNNSDRVYWIDVAKTIGMFLVYYGHVVEVMANKGSHPAFQQFKFIYSFHMPLFFIMAGFFFKRRYPSELTEIKLLFYKRVIPVFYFGLLTLPIWPVYMNRFLGRIDWHELGIKVFHYLRGHPDLNTITWFIVCLFTTEVIAIFVLRRVNKTIPGLLIAAIFFHFGLLMTLNIRAAVTSLGISKNTWYIHEALVAFGFYTVGYVTFKYFEALSKTGPLIRFMVGLVALALTVYTFDKNIPYQGFTVILKNSNHGFSGFFILTALSGSAAVILFSTLIPKNRVMDVIGRNTLILVATAGIFHSFINPYLANRLNNLDSFLWVTLTSLILAVASIALSLPFVWFLNKFTPQFVGKPFQEGPWLPGLNKLFRQAKGKSNS